METGNNVSPSEKAVVSDVLNRIKQVLKKKLTKEAEEGLVEACTTQRAQDVHRRHRNAKTAQMRIMYHRQWAAIVTATMAENMLGIQQREDYWNAQDRILVISGAVIPEAGATELTESQRKSGIKTMSDTLQGLKLWETSKTGFRVLGALIAGWGLLHLDVGGMVSGAVLGLSAPKLIDNRHEIYNWVKNQGLKATKSESAALESALATLRDAPNTQLQNPDGALA